MRFLYSGTLLFKTLLAQSRITFPFGGVLLVCSIHWNINLLKIFEGLDWNGSHC